MNTKPLIPALLIAGFGLVAASLVNRAPQPTLAPPEVSVLVEPSRAAGDSDPPALPPPAAPQIPVPTADVPPEPTLKEEPADWFSDYELAFNTAAQTFQPLYIVIYDTAQEREVTNLPGHVNFRYPNSLDAPWPVDGVDVKKWGTAYQFWAPILKKNGLPADRLPLRFVVDPITRNLRNP